MATSRLIVRNLGPNVDDKALRAHFTKHGEITDTKIMKTQGKSRCFAFIGFRLVKAAADAKKALDKSFIGSVRINVEYAKPRNECDKAIINAKDQKKNKKNKLIEENEDLKKKQRIIESNDQLKEDFVSTMKKRPSAWSDETTPVHVESDNDNDDEEEEDKEVSGSESEEDDVETTNLASNKALSDLNYLKAKSNLSLPNTVDSLPKTKTKQKKQTNEIKTVIANDEMNFGNETLSNRLFVKNLPFSVEEDELKELFSQHGQVSEVFIPVDELKRQKGFAFVSFYFPQEAIQAKEKLKQNIFQGRPLYISTAIDKNQNNNEEEEEGIEGGGNKTQQKKEEIKNGTYKQWKELERRKKSMETEGWNASHVRSDAVVDVISDRLNVNKSDFLDVNENNMAVRLAVGETHIISENVAFFEKEGIDLTTLMSPSSKVTNRRRSDVVIVIKNIPASTQAKELSQMFEMFGQIERFLLPPSKLVALVEFLDAKEAKKAFKALAYKRYQNVPLYLEWAPEQALKASPNKAVRSSSSSLLLDTYKDESDLINDETTSLFVKNLSFQTKEVQLKDFFTKGGLEVRNVFIPKNNSKGSSGYGFVEFSDKVSVEVALSKLQGGILQGRELELKMSSSNLKRKKEGNDEEEESENKKQCTQTKLLVKNVAFQTSIQEMRELFSTFGTLKSLSMPKKYDGKHRGFAFVDYVLPHEAEHAMKQLSSSHFYGRHLIIDWAKDESKSIHEIRNKAKKSIHAMNEHSAHQKNKDMSEKGFDEFMGQEGDDE